MKRIATVQWNHVKLIPYFMVCVYGRAECLMNGGEQRAKEKEKKARRGTNAIVNQSEEMGTYEYTCTHTHTRHTRIVAYWYFRSKSDQ